MRITAATRQAKHVLIERAKVAEKELQYGTQMGANYDTVEERQETFTLTLEADNIFIKFQKVDQYRINAIKHQLVELCSSLRIIENTITVTKEEQE